MASKKDPIQKVNREVNKAELTKLVKELVRIQSHRDAPGREKAVAEFICEFLTDEGVEARLRKAEKDRPNVISRIGGTGNGKSLMLNGHTDTVPAFEMDIEPFAPKVERGRIYGRGALDMKGGLGSMMMTLVAFERARVSLSGELILTAVVGEEDRSEGTEDIVLHGPKADMAIVGEPTDLEIQPSHRGLEWLDITFLGKAAHGGQADKGLNAITMAAKFVRKVEEELQPKLKAKKSRHMMGPSLNMGVIQGGQQPSSVADRCVVKIDRRWVPEESLDQVFQELYDVIDSLKREDPTFKAVLKRNPSNMKTMTHVPNVVSRNHPLVTILAGAAKKVTGKAPKVTSFWGWTDAALLTHFGKMPAVIYGPGGAGAHARTEYVLVDDLTTCSRVYATTAMGLCGIT